MKHSNTWSFSALLTMLVVLILSPAAQAHALPRSEAPAAGSTLAQAPSEVVITFSEPIEPRFSTLQVVDVTGARVDTNAAQTAADDGRLYRTALKKLTPGIYKVIWHVTSVDTHKTEGSYSFTVEK